MNKFGDDIRIFKEKKERLLKLKMKKSNCDTIQFYEDSSKVRNFNVGMVIIITGDSIFKEKVSRNQTHESIAESIIRDNIDENVDFNIIDGDFGHVISKKYNCVFIRIVSVLVGASMIYYPRNCNDFQITELMKFNREVKKFNASKRENLRTCFDYDGKGDEIEYNIDNVIADIINKKRGSR